jgi:AcrR family transcriptional regulator
MMKADSSGRTGPSGAGHSGQPAARSKKTGASSVKRRRRSRAGADTRDKLLDAAELTFADHGYEDASLRDIAEAAGLHLGQTTYHFGTKERLFDEVIHRRAIEMEQQRLARLARIDSDAQPVDETVRLMLQAYMEPMIQARYGESAQWQAHVRLMARLVNVKRWTPIVRKHYDRCAEVYVREWRRLLPNAERNALLDAFSFMVVTMLYVCSYTDRFSQWKNRKSGASGEEELQEVKEDLIDFVHAGFMALVSRKRR